MTTVTQISRRHGKAPSSGESRAVPPIRSRVQSCPLCLAARQTRTWTPAAPSRCECQESVSEMPRVPEGGVSQRGRDFQRQGREGAGEAKAWRRARGGLSWKPPPPTVPVGGSLVLTGRQRAGSGNPGDGAGIPAAAAPVCAAQAVGGVSREGPETGLAAPGPFGAQRPLGAGPPWTDGGRGPFAPDHTQQEPDWEIKESARGARNEGTGLCQRGTPT